MTGLSLPRQYSQDLEAIRAKVLEMGGLVEDQFRQAIHALQEGDSALAEKVVAADEQVNQLQVSLDRACVELLVRRQPAARDLRTIVATMRVLTDIERIGDEVTKVARAAANLQTRNLLLLDPYRPVRAIAEAAQMMLRQALDAYATMDKELAVQMMALDEELDHLFHEMTRNLMTYMMEEPKTISASLEISWAAKAIERIGDHATNIGESVIFVVEGDDVRHTDYARRVLGIG